MKMEVKDASLIMKKIHTRHDYQWIYPVHEVLKYLGQEPENVTYLKGVQLNHYPDSTKSRSSYLRFIRALGCRKSK